MKNLPKLIATDIDGVWTDGSMYYTAEGDYMRRFNTSDSAGVFFCKLFHIPLVVVSGEQTEITRKRTEKLQIDYIFLGVRNKKTVLEELIKELGISWEEVAYIGDDVNDLGVFEKAGFTAAPAQAPEYIKQLTDFVTGAKGGEGAFREFVEEIFKRAGMWESLMEKTVSFFGKRDQ